MEVQEFSGRLHEPDGAGHGIGLVEAGGEVQAHGAPGAGGEIAMFRTARYLLPCSAMSGSSRIVMLPSYACPPTVSVTR